jgi:hypothetical protein
MRKIVVREKGSVGFVPLSFLCKLLAIPFPGSQEKFLGLTKALDRWHFFFSTGNIAEKMLVTILLTFEMLRTARAPYWKTV